LTPYTRVQVVIGKYHNIGYPNFSLTGINT
jgi:hypothetical protein